MKSMIKFAGIVALATLIGFSMAGCENGEPENNGSGIDDGFVPVTNITGVNTSVPVGTVSLGGKVVPDDATHKTIKWSLLSGGDTEGTISGNKLTTAWEGFVKVMATVENGLAVGVNYTKSFNISVDPFVAVKEITPGFPNINKVGEIILYGYVKPDDASYTDIIWSISDDDAGTTNPRIRDDVLTTRSAGTVVVTATIIDGTAIGTNYTWDFWIQIDEL